MPFSDASPSPQPSARERILMAASDLFYAEGIGATGVDRIVERSKTAKASFYYHYSSKDALVLEFLEFRHTRWIAWFGDAIDRHRHHRKRAVDAVVPAMQEWFSDPSYRGCAFLNAVSELGAGHPGLAALARAHKRDIVAEISKLLPRSKHLDSDAETLAIAIDGAILRAQFDASPVSSLHSLARVVEAIVPAHSGE